MATRTCECCNECTSRDCTLRTCRQCDDSVCDCCATKCLGNNKYGVRNNDCKKWTCGGCSEAYFNYCDDDALCDWCFQKHERIHSDCEGYHVEA